MAPPAHPTTGGKSLFARKIPENYTPEDPPSGAVTLVGPAGTPPGNPDTPPIERPTTGGKAPRKEPATPLKLEIPLPSRKRTTKAILTWARWPKWLVRRSWLAINARKMASEVVLSGDLSIARRTVHATLWALCASHQFMFDEQGKMSHLRPSSIGSSSSSGSSSRNRISSPPPLSNARSNLFSLLLNVLAPLNPQRRTSSPLACVGGLF
ncbi:hypothetical protein V8F06_009622 [Rhypophila decipiens]